MNLVMRKPDICICENKDADQLRGNREADHRLCFRYIDSTIPLLSKSEIASLYSSSVAVQPSLCRTWSETPKTGFLTTRLKYQSDKTTTKCAYNHSRLCKRNLNILAQNVCNASYLPEPKIALISFEFPLQACINQAF